MLSFGLQKLQELVCQYCISALLFMVQAVAIPLLE